MAEPSKIVPIVADEKIDALDLLNTAKAEIEAGHVDILTASRTLVCNLDLYLMPLMYVYHQFLSVKKF